ncbi:MAG TPA: TonB-dependent receptor [Acidobacteriaceae bacterium]|jgi:hypothetical protein|nr:TonB-dependent receptor [Acidobacteriaceae bacterium]
MTLCSLRIAFLLVLAALTTFGAVVAWAAITGSISGIVTDPSGAVVPGVTVVATSISTNVQHTTVTDSKGFYSFPALNVDHYNVTASQSGYRNFLQIDVTINTNSALRIDIKLQLGAVSNTVTVKSNTLQVETQSTQMGEVIGEEKIKAIPLDGRSYIDLLKLQPGVVPYQGVSTASGSGYGVVSGDQSNGTQSISGGRSGSNAFMVNGADAEEGVQNGTALIPNLDSIQEFRILTSNFNAEYGNYGGGQVNVVTKSGTNQYHGDVFDFLRNTDLDAKNYYSSNRGVFIQNQFGGTIGGPIRRNKVFWFGDFQGTKQIIGEAQNFPVPSLADRSGDLMDQAPSLESTDPANGGSGVVGSYWASQLSQKLGYSVTPGEAYYSAGCTDTATCVFPNAVIPKSAMAPVALNMLKYIPTPNSTTNGQPYYETSAFNKTLSDYKGGIRVDTNTRFGSFFAYYFADKNTVVDPYAAVNIPGFDAQNKGLTQMANLGLTTTINNSTVNDVRFVYLRDVPFAAVPQGGLGVTLASLGFNTPWNSTGGYSSSDPALEGVPNLGFNNYSFGVPADTLRQFNNTVQLIDNVTKIIGTHTIQFGGDVHYDQINERNTYGQNGQFGFDGLETGYDFSDYLVGAPTYFIQASFQILDSRSKYYGFYGQDSWRVRPTLTLNYGLRWEVSTPWYDTQNKLETLIQGEQSQVFPGAPRGLVLPGDPGVPRTLGPVRYKNFGPRIGIAYAPDVESGWLGKLLGGPGKTSIRTGYGIFYTAIQDATSFVEVGDAPYGLFYYSPVPPTLGSPYLNRGNGKVQPSVNAFPFKFPPTNVSPSNPDTTFQWANVLPMSGSAFFGPNNVLPQTQQFQLSLQRQLGSASVLSLSYVGAVGRHLMTFEEANPGDQALCLYLNNPANLSPNNPSGPCVPGGESNQYIEANGTVVNGTRTRFGSNFGANNFMLSAASSSYNSLQASFQHQEKYANFLIAYTYSKSIDNGSSIFDPTNVYDPAQSRALSTFDVPQNLTISYTVQLPFNNFVGKGAVAKRFTAGWAVSGVTTLASGLPVQLNETDDRSLIGAGYSFDVPNYADNGSHLFVNKNPRTGQPYFNPNFFVKENLGQVGDAMRRYFHGPGIDNYDMALLKNTEISGARELQFRAEAFNVFNHAQFNGPDGNVNDTGTFGFVNSASDPRIMQVALKFLF